MTTIAPAQDVAIIRLYGDLSGQENEEFLAGAFYLGKPWEFDRAEREWQKILDEMSAIDGRAGKRFHATDFFAGNKAFRGWDRNSDQFREFAMRFAAVAANAGLIEFAFAVDNAAFRKILAPILAKERRQYTADDLRVFSAMQAVNLVASFLHKANNGNSPAQLRGSGVIVLEDEIGSERYSRFFKEARVRREKWTWWFGGFEFGDKSVVALQMADLLAHQSWHRARDLARDATALPSALFARILEGPGIQLDWIREELAEKNAEVFRRILESHPDGLVTDDQLARILSDVPWWRRAFAGAVAAGHRTRALLLRIGR